MAAFFCFRHDSEWLRTPGRPIDLVPMMPYQRLNAWRSCHQLALATYRITQSFPKSELYGITSQMRRAAFSAPANIAEGSAKRGPREFRRFLDIALGARADLPLDDHRRTALQLLHGTLRPVQHEILSHACT